MIYFHFAAGVWFAPPSTREGGRGDGWGAQRESDLELLTYPLPRAGSEGSSRRYAYIPPLFFLAAAD